MIEKLTPEIRFNGFNDAWRKRKLGEVCNIVGGGTPDTTNSDYWDGNINWYSPTEIGNAIYAFSSQRKITELGLKTALPKCFLLIKPFCLHPVQVSEIRQY
jgi:type I restriction enzyme S subunit